jgi:thiol:disulfide interchange protein DsbD
LVFTAVALGLALPYLLLTFNPAWMRLLPKPGAWMEILKQLTAIPIFATVIWLVWVYTQTAGANALIPLLSALLVLAIAGWVIGRYPAKRIPALVALSLVALAVAAVVYGCRSLATTSPAAQSSADHSEWQPWSEARLAEARAEGRPVFVDFTASWCLSCQVNEHAILDSSAVKEQFQQANVVLLRADWTQHDDAIAKALAELGRNGVPTYALYLPGRDEPLVLPELLTQGIVLDALSKVTPEQ